MKKPFWSLFLGSLFIYLAFLPPGIQSLDGYSMLQVADSLVTRHDVTVPPGSGIAGRNGQIYSSWYPLQSVIAVPVVAAALKASTALHLPIHYIESLSVSILPAIYTALTVSLVYLLAVTLGSGETGAWLAAVVYGFGTFAMVYAKDFYADPLLALLVALGLLLAFGQGFSGWVVLMSALAVLAKPTGILLGFFISLYLFCKTRRFWPSLGPGVGSVCGLCLYFFYNLYRFQNPLIFGQPWKFSAGFVPEGLAGLLISPGGGLVWFCPCVVLSLVALGQVKRHRLEAWTIVAFAASFLLFHSFWHEWSGGSSWGPRLLLPILPGLIALTGILNQPWRRALAALALLTFLMTAPTLVASYKRYYAEVGEQQISKRDYLWAPRDSLLLNLWPSALRQIQDARQNDVRQLFSQYSDTSASTISSSRALRIVSVWWWVLPVVHISRVWGILVSGLLLGSGVRLMAMAKPRTAGFEDPSPLFEVPVRTET